MNTKDLITVPSASKEFGMVISTIHNWIKAGKLNVYRIDGVRFLKITEVRALYKQSLKRKVGRPIGMRHGKSI